VVLKGITQYKVSIHEDEDLTKQDCLLEFLDMLNYSKVMVFANKTQAVRDLGALLKA